MKKLLLLLLFLPLFGYSSHIVGGEFELLHVSDNTYSLRLILYFDQINGNAGAKDPNMTVRIFRKSDNWIMRDVFLSQISEDPVDYFQPECSNGEIETNRIVYANTIELTPEEYNDALGYYVVWERCCRNYTINNIVSEDPNSGGVGTGQTFYLEFPAVVRDGEPFINSTPRLFPPLNDYACPNRFYYVDFQGVDADGDSLAYSIENPLNSSSEQPVPVPTPIPHQLVPWKAGYGLNNIMNGDPDLDISIDGYLTVVPKTQGLYVFAVKCEEYREGVKIGEVRRDFQMLVVDQCPEAVPPVIKGKRLSDGSFGFVDNMTVNFPNTATDATRCIEVQITDEDSKRVDENKEENIFLRAIALNFKENVDAVLPSVSFGKLEDGSALTYEICFEECPYLNPKTEGPFDIGIIAFDDACALPLTDTLRLTVNIEPPLNHEPTFDNPSADNERITTVVQEGDSWSVSLKGIDLDNDALLLDTLLNDGELRLADFGMSLERLDNIDGEVNAVFNWDTKCDVYDFTEIQDFELKVIIDDVDFCGFGEPDTLIMDLQVHLPDNTDPNVYTDYTGGDVKYNDGDSLYIEKYIFESLNLSTFSTDTDGDDFSLFGEGEDFDFADYGIAYPDKKWGKNRILQSNLQWDINCNVNIDEKDEFKFFFLTEDKDKCKFPNYDTLLVFVKVLPPLNNAPTLLVNSNNDVAVSSNEVEVFTGQALDLTITGIDPNSDFIKLELIEISGPRTLHDFDFANKEGVRQVSSDLTWIPTCEMLNDGLEPATYTFHFKLIDNTCFNEKEAFLELDVTIKNIPPNNEQYFVPNFISPNGDGYNDAFRIAEVGPEHALTEKYFIPLDNCSHTFEKVSIVNRWGKEVFVSTTRNFVWKPDGEKSGVYYYHIRFTNDLSYRGPLTIRY